MQSYILDCLGAREKHIPTAMKMMSEKAKAYPYLKNLKAACYIKIGEYTLRHDPSRVHEAERWYGEVIEMGSEVRPYVSLAKEKLMQLDG